jgi:hypothetical protein
MKIIFINVSGVPPARPAAQPTTRRMENQLMEQHKVFSPIAEQGQLAHLSATHSNALVENPFDDNAVAAETDSDK